MRKSRARPFERVPNGTPNRPPAANMNFPSIDITVIRLIGRRTNERGLTSGFDMHKNSKIFAKWGPRAMNLFAGSKGTILFLYS